MRSIALLLIGAAIVGCATTAAQQPIRTAKAQQRYDQLLAGKVAGPPVSCLPTYHQDDMVVIDEQTVAFRQGSSRVYVNHMQGGCMGIDHGRNALVTRTPGPTLCRGDIAQVVDTLNGMQVGSCVWGDFVPYVRPKT